MHQRARHVFLIIALGAVLVLISGVVLHNQTIHWNVGNVIQHIQETGSDANGPSLSVLITDVLNGNVSNDQQIQVVSFSLSGSNPRYTDGAIANAELARQIYPNWVMRVYHDKTVPTDIIEKLRKLDVELVDITNVSLKSIESWRFLVASDVSVKRYIIRDIDSRLSSREKAAVDEWIASGERFHVMRDHPSHSLFPMSSGMWGGTREAVPDMKQRLQKRELTSAYLQEQIFLNQQIWGLAQKSLIQHDAFSCENYGSGLSFPTARIGWEHVGSVYINGKMRQGDVNILKRTKQPVKCVRVRKQ